MIVSLCGTPGTGKTTVCRQIPPKEAMVMDMNALITELVPDPCHDPASDSLVVDVDELRRGLAAFQWPEAGLILIEGHLSYLAPSDLCLLLRLDPREIKNRLLRRGYSETKARENAEAEGVGTLQIWAMEEETSRLAGQDPEGIVPGCGLVLERDVTGMEPGDIASWIHEMVRGYDEKELKRLIPYRPGNVDWLEVLSDWF
ncbi:MAG: AAA family ATPase [Candidatus Thermoplasmatota archaeon]|nr:AAA family ATPase [Candidatus Thermoplasmatota archaeon]